LKIDREILVEKLESALDDLRYARREKEKVITYLSKHNIIGIVDELMIDKNKLHEIDLNVLCLLAIAIGEANGQIDPNVYFNEPELKAAVRFQETVVETLKYPIVFDEVLQVNNFSWVTTADVRRINELNNSGLLHYRFETQRTAKFSTAKDGGIIQKPDINKESVKQISKLMLEGRYKSDAITFNILLDGTDDITYDAKNKRLIINSGEIDILDGFHRIQAMQKALEDNPDLDLQMIVSIKNYTLEDARFFFGQINTINQVDKTRIKELKNERIADMIVNELSTKSELRGKISSNTRLTGTVGHITNFAILADAIDDVFKPKTRADFIEISPYLVDFFSYLVAKFNNAFVDNYDTVKKQSWMNHHNMFVGYTVLAKKFYDSNLPVKRLVDVMERISFEKGSSPFDLILAGSGKDSSNKIKRLIKQEFEKIDL
jgi:hypothetical protein